MALIHGENSTFRCFLTGGSRWVREGPDGSRFNEEYSGMKPLILDKTDRNWQKLFARMSEWSKTTKSSGFRGFSHSDIFPGLYCRVWDGFNGLEGLKHR